MKYDVMDIGGEVIKDNETYILKDNKLLNNLVLSSTQLHPGQTTRGHKHEGQEEVYYFVKGAGTMWLDEKEMSVKAGDVVLIEDGVHHKVSCGPDGLYFVCVFDGKRNH